MLKYTALMSGSQIYAKPLNLQSLDIHRSFIFKFFL